MSDSATPWTAARQASLSIANSWSLLKLMSIESVMPSNHLILCHPLLLLPSVFPSIRVFSNESVLHIRWPKYWSFSFSSLWACLTLTKFLWNEIYLPYNIIGQIEVPLRTCPCCGLFLVCVLIRKRNYLNSFYRNVPSHILLHKAKKLRWRQLCCNF